VPTFEVVSQQEAELRAATGRRAEITREYLGYVNQLAPGQAGCLRPSEGETVAAVRRRLGTAAKLGGQDLTIKRVGDEIYFWVKARRRGRPRKSL
jgi:hypothetical protein